MSEPMGDPHAEIEKVIRACRDLIKSLSDPTLQPLEREAGYILAKALRIQVQSLGLLENPDVKRFLALQDETRPSIKVRRFPQDFDLDQFPPAAANR